MDNYDATTQEPTLLPVTFPTILCNNTLGIAVGMASNICSFNLAEVCNTTIALLKNEKADLFATLKAPDFVGGGYLLYDEDALRRIYETGRGAVRVRAKYRYVKEENIIEVTQIPPTTTVEAIMDKISDLAKAGRVKELSDIRDETDLGGLKLALDLKRGQDPDKLMAKLFKLTPLEDSFSCNFNVLVGGMPRVMGVRQILTEWSAFRAECVRRRTYYDLAGKKKRLHLLKGLKAILLDIDKAVKIVRETEEEDEVVPNLMIGFGIDKEQGEYVAEIKLRQLNREHILKRTAEIGTLEEEIADLEDILNRPQRIRQIMIDELRRTAEKYGEERHTEILYDTGADEPEQDSAGDLPDYPVTVFFTREGYFKKITPASLRMSSDQKLKEGDAVRCAIETQNNAHLLFFTNRCQVYKCRAGEFEDTKASLLGDYIPARLGMEEGELPVYMAVTDDSYKGFLLFFFENGKVARVPLESYATKQNRRKLLAAYSDKSPLVTMEQLSDECELAIETSASRLLLVHTTQIAEKTTRSTVGVQVVTLKKNVFIKHVRRAEAMELENPHRYRVRTLPAAGALLRSEDLVEQISL